MNSMDAPQRALPLANAGTRRLLVQVAGVVAFAGLTAVASQIRLYLPGTPVPVTLQTLVVLLAGMTLGPWLGMAGMAFYLLLGICGYHVFAGDAWQSAYLFGPTGGYLLGFVLAQPVIGLLTRRGGGWGALLAAALAGNAIIFAAGLTWLHLWSGASALATLTMGLWPFVPGLILKTAAATAGGRALQPVSRRLFAAR
ncbi:MAG TPA: biotin transporter BioY [Phycisphaerae bacterium]|nr:biotin transporter BioY [Phycisphaerae bacterium]